MDEYGKVDLRRLPSEKVGVWREAIEQAGYSFECVRKYEPIVIADYYFEEHAEELAIDLGMMNSKKRWPLNHVDWAAAAAELKQDYIKIIVDDETYWFCGF